MGKINGWRVIKQRYGRASVQGKLIYIFYKESLIHDKNRNGGRAVWKYDDPVVVI